MGDRLLYHALLRPSIIQILRAQGFSASRPSVVDTLTDIAARYLMLLASRTAVHAHTAHLDATPDITDVRMAMTECGLLRPTQTASEEAWTELLRKPIEAIKEDNDVRRKEAQRRDAEDTEDVEAFTRWFRSKAHAEIVRVAGLQTDGDADEPPVDYVTALRKKHSKAGVDERFAGTVLGKEGECRPVSIGGAPGQPESVQEWLQRVVVRQNKLDAMRPTVEEEVDAMRHSMEEEVEAMSETVQGEMDTTRQSAEKEEEHESAPKRDEELVPTVEMQDVG